MKTLQEYLERWYPSKKEKEWLKKIDVADINLREEKWGKGRLGEGNLDLSDFVNLENINANACGLVELTLGKAPMLKILSCSGNQLTSVDFLNQLSNPEKLEELWIFNNNIQPTDISFFNKFINLKVLKIGDTYGFVNQKKYNCFYGSLKAYRNLTKLEAICIEATDVSEGLEYLPMNLAKNTAKKTKEKGGYFSIECSPHDINAKCSAIQDQLRPFNYDLEAWQLAHPHLMYKTQPELFFDSELKTVWITALRNKTNKTQEKLNETKEKEPQAVKRIKRLEMKLDNLKLIQQSISKDALIDKLQENINNISLKEQKKLVKKEDKATQTEETIETKQTEQKHNMPGSWKWK